MAVAISVHILLQIITDTDSLPWVNAATVRYVNMRTAQKRNQTLFKNIAYALHTK